MIIGVIMGVILISSVYAQNESSQIPSEFESKTANLRYPDRISTANYMITTESGRFYVSEYTFNVNRTCITVDSNTQICGSFIIENLIK